MEPSTQILKPESVLRNGYHADPTLMRADDRECPRCGNRDVAMIMEPGPAYMITCFGCCNARCVFRWIHNPMMPNYGKKV